MKRAFLLILTTRILLVCYLVVASVAAAHAFPMLNVGGGPGDQSVNMSGVSCHQVSSLTNSKESKSPSSCNMFCSAMANVLPGHSSHRLFTPFSCDEITYTRLAVLNHAPELEPHPPK